MQKAYKAQKLSERQGWNMFQMSLFRQLQLSALAFIIPKKVFKKCEREIRESALGYFSFCSQSFKNSASSGKANFLNVSSSFALRKLANLMS
jgi:hypothetical protein